MREVRVEAAGESYRVILGDHLLGQVGTKLRKLRPEVSDRVLLVADAALEHHYLPVVQRSLAEAGFNSTVYRVAPGESSKSFRQLEPLLSCAAQHRLDRDGVVVALGGGVTGDLAGFAAAIYQRGVRLIQVPTTLLAMVDSSVGGKTGINLDEGKNLVGAFLQPSLVLGDLTTLATLPIREFNAGMAEVIKYGCIADPHIFTQARLGRGAELGALIQRCIEIKAGVVAADPYERLGLRATLNFGHTVGHALEKAAGYGNLLHGEAVAIGMMAAAYLSSWKCGLKQSEVESLAEILQAQNLPTTASGFDLAVIKEALKIDKKAKAGLNQWVLLKRFGATELRSDVTAAELEQALQLIITPA
jgi:3-dehydroquinate synthase